MLGWYVIWGCVDFDLRISFSWSWNVSVCCTYYSCLLVILLSWLHCSNPVEIPVLETFWHKSIEKNLNKRRRIYLPANSQEGCVSGYEIALGKGQRWSFTYSSKKLLPSKKQSALTKEEELPKRFYLGSCSWWLTIMHDFPCQGGLTLGW